MSRQNELMATTITAPVHPDLKKLIARKAREERLPMNWFIARILAGYLERPDLANVPSKQRGRPPKNGS